MQTKIYGDGLEEPPTDPYLEYQYTSRLLGKYGEVKQITDYRNEDDRPGGEGSQFTFDYWYLSGKVRSYEDYEGYTVHYDYLRAYDRQSEVQVIDPDYPEDPIYWVKYSYDLAGRLVNVREPLLEAGYQLIAGFDYDDNGNRSQLRYYLDGQEAGDTVSIDYTYNACECQCDNHLVAFSTSGVAGLDFEFDATAPGDIDGLGHLHSCSETLTKVGGGQATHTCTYDYDMMSRLLYAKITDVAPKPHIEYTNTYDDAGNLTTYIYNEGSGDITRTYGFNGDLVIGDDTGKIVDWDDNGRQTSQLSSVPDDYFLEYDWEGRLRQGKLGASNRLIEAKYTPDGARVTKKKIWDGATVYHHKYIVDPTGKVPVVLLVLDAENNNAILKTYIHANNQVIAQHDGAHTANRYFYLHDRLGSVRQVINNAGAVVNCYTYDPWGLPVGNETQEMISNMYLFANYVWDSEISQYHCYRRQYDPVLGRFTSRDPVEGNYQDPMTLHRYLYCNDDPINTTDPTGSIGIPPIFEEIAELFTSRNQRISDAVSSASDAWEMAENLTTIHEDVATKVQEKALATRAFRATGCLAKARANAMEKAKSCLVTGAATTGGGIAGCIVGCSFSGPMMPLCLSTCLKVVGIASTASNEVCAMEMVGIYNRDVMRCMQ